MTLLGWFAYIDFLALAETIPLPDKGAMKSRASKWKPAKKHNIPTFRYLDCIPKEERFCSAAGEHGGRLEAHHIIPRHLGGGDEPENLVALCVAHHALVDKYRAKFLVDEQYDVDVGEHY